MSFKIPFEILLLTSSVGALQSIFFGIYLFTIKKGNRIATRLLAFLLLALAVRMIKSVSYYFAEGHVIPQMVENIGYAAHFAISPLLWLYLNAFIKKDYRFRLVYDGVHLVPPALIILLSPFLTSYFWLAQNGYTVALLLMGFYLPFCFYLIVKHFKTLGQPKQIWLLSLTTGVTLVWGAYMANFLLGLVSYITAPVIFSFVMYFMSYLGLKQNNIFIDEKKYKNSAFTSYEIQQAFDKLSHLMMEGQPYKDAGLTLPKLARQLTVSPNLLSQAINEMAGQNFPDFINSYRIKDAKQMLTDPECANQKISSLAFDTGFNTLSAFNGAFKKFTQMTPSEFRKKASSSI